MDSIPGDPAAVERSLLHALAWWAGGSMAVGGALWAIGTRTERAAVRAFGRQSAAWGAVDGVIAGVGWARRATGSPPSSGEHLRRLLILNAVLDVGYMTAGAGLILARDRLGSRPRYSAGQAVGDGAAVIVQGGYLLVSDAVHARRLGQPA